jgi:Domain of unknown function (DUF1707)
MRTPELRASDADRDNALDLLCAAVADGRLTLAELEARAEAALSAPTLTELARLIADLPGPIALPTAAWSGQADELTSRPGDLTARRWALIRSVVAPG